MLVWHKQGLVQRKQMTAAIRVKQPTVRCQPLSEILRENLGGFVVSALS